MICNLCKSSFSDINIFISHLTYQHNVSHNFKCVYEDCYRIFHKRHAFKRHLILNHVPAKLDKFDQETSENIINFTQSSSITQCDIHVNKKLKTNIHTEYDIYRQDFEENENSTFFYRVLDTAVNKFISKLYSIATLSRSAIQEIIVTVSDLFSSGILSILKKNVSSGDMTEESCAMLTSLENIFGELDTEYKRFQHFENSSCFVKPISYFIGSNVVPKRKRGNVSLELEKKFSYFVPMRSQLKLFLSIPGVYQTMLNYRSQVYSENLSNDNIHFSNIMQGEIWQTYLKKIGSKNVFPLIIYFDDFETCNPLGSHANVHKQGAVYFSVGSLPPQFATRLENIFLVLLFNSSDRNKFGNAVIFKPLIEELKYLEEIGIEIIYQGKEEQVFFSLVVITGDNLGLHSIFGLTESFSSNYCCRFCKTHKLVMQTLEIENEDNLRTIDEYDEMVSELSYGIKEKCIFHELPNFHIFNNLTCDIMHDLTEGVHRYTLAKIVYHFICEKFFSLDYLNHRIRSFSYNPSEKNIPPPIKLEHLKNGCIILSSAEMMCLVLNLRLIIGDLIPENDAVWNCYLVLLEITEILIASSISFYDIELLRALIEDLNHSYKSLFNEKLKPKFHFLLHYPRVIKRIGPPCYIQSIRYEAKHRDLKVTSNIMSNRKNTPLTLSTRLQLKCCNRILSQTVLKDEVLFGPFYKIDTAISPFKTIIDGNNYYCIMWYEINGLRYNKQSVLIHSIINDIPQFCIIDHIIVFQHEVLFMTILAKTESFNLHLRSYKVYLTQTNKLFKYEYFKNNPPTILHTLTSGENYLFVSKMV